MCDTMVIVERGRVLFAKNSDRDANEAQIPEWHPRRAYPAGATVQCTHLTIPQIHETCAVLLSRPYWMWGAEMGANEYGVVIGNEAVFTSQPYAATGLTGMDLLRLGLERAYTAQGACAVITRLLEEHGQGGGCGHERRRFTYHNSFLIADPGGAYVLETAGRHWAIEGIAGAYSISNGLTLSAFSRRYSDRLRTRISGCHLRRGRTSLRLGAVRDVLDLFAALRDHGEDQQYPSYSWVNGGMHAPCVHAGGIVASCQTTASWVSELRPGALRHWVTATSAPCTSLFKPVYVERPVEMGASPDDRADDSLWWRHERFQRTVLRDPEALFSIFAGERDAIETRWTKHPPASQEAFDEHDKVLGRWYGAVCHAAGRDRRPWWVRRYWRERNRRAGWPPSGMSQ